MDDITSMVRGFLRSYRKNQHYDDLVQEGVVVALSNTDVDPKELSFLVKNRAAKYLKYVTDPVRVPYDNKYDKKLSSVTRRMSSTSSVELDDGVSLEPDHSGSVLLMVALDGLHDDLREFAMLKASGEGRTYIMDKMGLSRVSYYELLDELRGELL